MAPKKRPAASDTASLKREVAKLKKENAALRGEDPKKMPRVAPAGQAYVTGLIGGKECLIQYEMEGFGKNRADELATTLSEVLRDGRPFELTLKGGKKVNLKKTFDQNGIKPNSYVYGRYTGPAPWD